MFATTLTMLFLNFLTNFNISSWDFVFCGAILCMHKRIKNGGIVKKIIKIFIFFQNISGLLVGPGGRRKPLLFKFKLVKLDYCKFV